jgi:Domain of unknown function (DUF4412)
MSKFYMVSVAMLFLATNIFSQSYLGKQRSFQLEEEQMTSLSGSGGDLDKMADFFFALDFNDILKKAKTAGFTPEQEEGTIYVEGKKFRMDMTTMGQKMSAILNLETREIISIMHEQKQYFVMNIDELKAMQAKMQQTMAANMESMKGMMDNLPPEAKAMMEKMSGQKKSAPPKVTATGKTKTVNGFSCKEYLVGKENEREHLWITSDYSNLRDAFYEMATSMPEPGEETESQWQEIKEGWPVQTSTVRGKEGYMDGSFSIHEVYSMEKAKHKAGTFDPPAGYTKKTMEEMMGGMQGYDE